MYELINRKITTHGSSSRDTPNASSSAILSSMPGSQSIITLLGVGIVVVVAIPEMKGMGGNIRSKRRQIRDEKHITANTSALADAKQRNDNPQHLTNIN